MVHDHYLIKSMFRISPGTPFLLVLIFQVLKILNDTTRLGQFCLCRRMKNEWDSKIRQQFAKLVDQDNLVQCQATFFSVVDIKDKRALTRRDLYLRVLLNINAYDIDMINRMNADNDQRYV